MKTLLISSETIYRHEAKAEFLIIADDKILKNKKAKIDSKIKKETKLPIDGFWATLGRADDEPIHWTGSIRHTTQPVTKSKGIVAKEIELIKAANPNLEKENIRVLEREIRFEYFDAGFEPTFSHKGIPKLRLTLMLEQDESALVFYDYSKKSDPENDALEYIQPQPTTDKQTREEKEFLSLNKNFESFTHETDKRDRLTYIFPAPLPRKLQEVDLNKYELSEENNPLDLTLKILTFKRKPAKTSDEVIRNVQAALAKMFPKQRWIHKHQLLIFDPENNDFNEVTGSDLSQSKKTLFLMHGTFSTVWGSFEALFGKNAVSGKENKWLKNQFKQNGGEYDQIIAFNYPSVLYGAEENKNKLFELLGDNFKFIHPVDFIGTSQGGLHIQYLANLKPQETKIPVGKCALVASANGVDYFTDGDYIKDFLSISKEILKIAQKPMLAFIAALAQHSAEWFLKQPGSLLMTPGSAQLKEIINKRPKANSTIYLPVIDDFQKNMFYDKNLYPHKPGLFKRMAMTGADLLISAIIGSKYNDWVVRTENQFKVPETHCFYPNYQPDDFKQYIIPALHGKCINTDNAKDQIQFFFASDTSPEDFIAFLKKQPLYHGFNHKLYPLNTDMSKEKFLAKAKKLFKDQRPIDRAKHIEPLLYKEDLVIDSHSHIFDIFSVPAPYLHMKLFDYKETYKEIFDEPENMLTSMLSDATESWTDLGFLQNFAETTLKKPLPIELRSQLFRFLKEEIFTEYTNFITLPLMMDMEAGWSNAPEKLMSQQIQELQGMMEAGDEILPFLAVDPRKIPVEGTFQAYNENEKDAFTNIIDAFSGENPFFGVKIYPGLGYLPEDERLDPIFEVCAKYQIPVTTHCGSSKIATFNLDDCENQNPKIQAAKKAGKCDTPFERARFFNDPKHWRPVLDKHKKLILNIAHFGGYDAWDSWIKKDKKKDEQDRINTILNLIREYDNVYTDFSSNIKKKKYVKMLKKMLQSGNYPDLKKRIMFGTDFWVVNPIFPGRLKNKIKKYKKIMDTPLWKQTTQTNVLSFLGLGTESSNSNNNDIVA